MTRIEYGININPRANNGQPAVPAELRGATWARLVFQRAAALFPDLAAAYQYYDPIVQGYDDEGVGCLLILNQETYWGHGPWNYGDWESYADGFAADAGQIATHYAGRNVAYQIWNEGDHHGEASVYVAPDDFAPVLARSAAAIRAADPDAKIVLGGLASGTETAIRYVKDLRTALGGGLPVDAIAVHPYGHWPPSGQPTIPTGWFAPLESALGRYCTEFAGTPIWITEIGVSEPGGIGSDHWPSIASYLEETLGLIQGYYVDAVPVVIWFAWSDVMRGAGIVDVNGNPKQPIYTRFFDIVRADVTEQPSPVIPPPTELTLTPSTWKLYVREGPGMNYVDIGAIERGDRVTVVESWETAWAKLGQRGKWINLRAPANVVGWSGAFYLQLAVDIPDEAPPIVTPNVNNLRLRSGPGLEFSVVATTNPGDLLTVVENWQAAAAKLGHPGKWINVRTSDGDEGWSPAWSVCLPDQPLPPDIPVESMTFSEEQLLHALSFDRDPLFVRVPVSDPTDVRNFSGFGPNNYSYRTYSNGRNYYGNLSQLHNGLDFGIPIGTPLCAADWGVVVHVSKDDDDNPCFAGPYTVILRHGRYIAVYGHMRGYRPGVDMFVAEGDIVAPGQELGLSGISNNYEHLHFEVRKIQRAHINQLRRDAEEHTDVPLEQLRHMQANFRLDNYEPSRRYVNPAPFFEPRLETHWDQHGWGHACWVAEDTNRNGYPDRVVLAGEQEPRDLDLYTISAYPYGRAAFWAGSHVEWA